MMVRGKKAIIMLFSIVFLLAISCFVSADDLWGCCCEPTSGTEYFLNETYCANAGGTFIEINDSELVIAITQYGGDFNAYCEDRCSGEVPPTCGDGIVQGYAGVGEQCDPGDGAGILADLDDQTCLSLGFLDQGTLSCDENCNFNTSDCTPRDCEYDDECTPPECHYARCINNECQNFLNTSLPGCQPGVCTPGQCDADEDRWCNAEGMWNTYDLSNSDDFDDYCDLTKCHYADPDCYETQACVPDGSSGICPPGCLADSEIGDDVPGFDPDCVCISDEENLGPPGCVPGDATNPCDDTRYYDYWNTCPEWCSGDLNAPNYDQDCTHYATGTCDDGEKQEWEECDDGDPGFPCTNGVCIDKGEMGECTCFSLPDACIEFYPDIECYPGDSCGAGVLCNEDCTCNDTCIVENIELSLESVTGERAFNLMWSLEPQACPETGNYLIYRCLGNETSCVDYGNDFSQINETAEMLFFDYTAETETDYCYYARGFFDSGEVNSTRACSNLGHTLCIYRGEFEQFCLENVAYECLVNNSLREIENCTESNEICMRIYAGEEPTPDVECTAQGNCTRCNGVFAMYAAMNYILDYNSNFYACADIDTCVLDYTSTTVDKYHYCSEIDSCYDYNSENTCKDDICQANNCTWKFINEELGKGICKSEIPEEQDCEACEEPWCNDWLCKYYGDCYYDNEGRRPRFCVHQSETVCRMYDTEEDCIIGNDSNNQGSDFNINVSYGGVVAGRRHNGTHEILASSKDYFSYGKCKWDEDQTGDSCYRDADDNSGEFPQDDGKKDCENFYDFRCATDFEAPSTTIIPDQSFAGDTVRIEYSVMDTNYDITEIETFYCFTELGDSCYPTRPATYNKFTKYFPENIGEQNYLLFYYSKDPSKNLELVQTYQFTLDSRLLDGNVTFNPGSPQHEGDGDSWMTDMNIILTLNRDATCNASLTNSSGDEIQRANSIGDPSLYGDFFERYYTGLRDDRYYYTVDCIDDFGNEFHEVFEKSIEGDLRITNPQPNETINYALGVEISIDTAYTGTCKYDKDPKDYGKMRNTFRFNSADPTHHMAVRNFPYSLYERFYVACDFDGVGIVYGTGAADEIRFVIDEQGPVTQAIDIHNGASYAFGYPQTPTVRIGFSCVDIAITPPWDARDLSFGCEKVMFNLFDNPSVVYLPTFSKLFAEEGIYTLTFYGIDAGGNEEELLPPQPKQVIVDSTAPEFTIDVTDVYGVPTDTLGFGSYFINVVSSEPVKLNGTLAGLKLSEPFKILIPSEHNFDTHWEAQLDIYPDDPDFDSIEIDSYIVATGEDMAGNPGSASFAVHIDTITPPEPVFEPEFTEYADPYGYPLNTNGTAYFTNQENLFVTGHTAANQEHLQFYYARDEPFMYDYDQALLNAEAMFLATSTVHDGSPVNYGENQIRLSDTVLENWVAGDYINILDHERIAYGNYKRYYKIEASKNEKTGSVLLNISPSLEMNIPAGATVQRFSKENPFNWFGVNLTLPYGRINLLSGYTNYIGYSIYNTEHHEIYYDPNIPIVMNKHPIDETVNNIDANITFSIVDEGLDPDSVGHIIEQPGIGTFGHDYDVQITQITEDQKRYDFILDPDGPLADGVYEVKVNGTDYAGNDFNVTWEFEIREHALDSPDFRWREGFIQPSPLGIYYINNIIPKFVLVYPIEELSWWNITLDGESGLTDWNMIAFAELDEDIKANLTRPLSSFVLNCTFLQEVEEGLHDLTAEANASVEGKPTEPGYKTFQVDIDTEIPDYTLDMPTLIRSNISVPIDLTVFNEREVIVVMEISGQTIELETTSSGIEFHTEIPASFDWGVPMGQQQTKNAMLRISDYAGNYVEEPIAITIDNIPPVFEIVDIHPECIELMENSDDCATNAIKLRIDGNLTYTDTVFMYAYEGEEYSAAARRGEISSCNGGPVVDCIGTDTFSINITLSSQTSQEVMNNLTLMAVDEAGNEFGAVLRILHDSLAPAQPDITIT